jgi:nucleotide-binding universal stress UspA family protein
MARVLIAVDDAEHGATLARCARDLFGSGSEYLALNVGQPMSTAVPYGIAYPYAFDDVGVGLAAVTSSREVAQTERLLAEDARLRAQEGALAGGLDQATPIGELGDPVDVIVAEAERHAVDVIVIGSRERNWLSRLVSPSVTKAVESRAERPVLVVKLD